jgi:hypothetical protein
MLSNNYLRKRRISLKGGKKKKSLGKTKNNKKKKSLGKTKNNKKKKSLGKTKNNKSKKTSGKKKGKSTIKKIKRNPRVGVLTWRNNLKKVFYVPKGVDERYNVNPPVGPEKQAELNAQEQINEMNEEDRVRLHLKTIDKPLIVLTKEQIINEKKLKEKAKQAGINRQKKEKSLLIRANWKNTAQRALSKGKRENSQTPKQKAAKKETQSLYKALSSKQPRYNSNSSNNDWSDSSSEQNQ